MAKGNYHPLAGFGDAILKTVIPPVSEAATDLVAQELLKIANCDPVRLVPFPQRGQFEVKVTLLRVIASSLIIFPPVWKQIICQYPRRVIGVS